MTVTDVTAATPAQSITNENSERWYPYPPTGDLLDSVTTVIGATNSKPWLQGWAGAVSTAWALDHMDELFQEWRRKGRKAAIALGKGEAERLRQVKSDAGTYIHDVMEALILWGTEQRQGLAKHIPLPLLPDHLARAMYDDEPLQDVVDAMTDGFIRFVADFQPEFLATEMQVYNEPLGVAGTLDMIVALNGYGICNGINCNLAGFCPGTGSHAVPARGKTLTVCVDGKTGRSPEGTWKEQLAAYRRMTECRPDRLDDTLHPMPATDCGAVLHLRREYPDGYLLMLVAADDDQAAWERFQAAARIFRERQQVKAKPGRVIRPVGPGGAMPGPRLCDMAGEGYGRALAPLREALGADCELATLADFTAAEVLAIKRVGPKLIATIRTMLAANGLYLRGEELTPVLEAVRETAGPKVA